MMTTTTNIQMSANTATEKTNNNLEEGTMIHPNNNINMVARISNIFRMENISKLGATAAVGPALTIGVAMPDSVNAETLSVTNVRSQYASNNDDFFLVFGTPDAPAKVILLAADNMPNDHFSMVFGNPDSIV